MKTLNYALKFNGQNTYTGTGTFYSDVIQLESIMGYSVTSKWTVNGSPTNCYVTLEGTVDDINWIEEPRARIIINVTGDVLYNVFEVYYKAMRVKYSMDNGSGTLTVEAHINAKGV